MRQATPGEEGFTLIELVVGLLIGTIVMLATFQSLDMFNKTASTATRNADASDQLRTIMERTVRDLRGASAITYAANRDLIYTTTESGGTRYHRLCVSSNALYGFSQTSAVTTATACNAGTKLAKLKTTSATQFSYDGASSSSTPATIKNVGVTLGLTTDSASRPTTKVLTASASRRVGTLAYTDSDIDPGCASDGALLKLDAALPGLSGLNVTWATDGGVSLGTTNGASTLKIPRGVTNVVATVTDTAGLTSILKTQVEC